MTLPADLIGFAGEQSRRRRVREMTVSAGPEFVRLVLYLDRRFLVAGSAGFPRAITQQASVRRCVRGVALGAVDHTEGLVAGIIGFDISRDHLVTPGAQFVDVFGQ